VRWFLRQHGLRAPSAARLAAILDQLTLAPADARVRLAHAGAEIGFYRGRVVVHGAGGRAVRGGVARGAPLALPHGALEFTVVHGRGIAREALEADPSRALARWRRAPSPPRRTGPHAC
jgi:hypothetical protein